MKMFKRFKMTCLWLFLAVGFFVCVPSQVQAGDISLKTVSDPTTQGDGDVVPFSPNCDPTTLKANYQSKWWYNPLKTVMDASESVGKGVFSSCASGMLKLVCVGAGLWLATFMMKVLGGMVESDPMENLTKVGGMMLKCGFAAVFLEQLPGTSGFFTKYIFNTIIELVTGLSGSGGGGSSGALLGLADQIHAKIAELRGKAEAVRCFTPHALILFGYAFPFIDLGVWGGGVAVGCVAVLFNLAFPFFLFDAAFRMGVTMAVCPLFVGAWVFDVTRGYSKKGVNAVMNVAFVYLMVFITAQIAIKLITSESGLDQPVPDQICKFRMFEFGDEAECASGPDLMFIFKLAICAVYGLLIMKEGSDKLASYFSDASFSNDTAFQAAKGGATAPVQAFNSGVNMAGDVAGSVHKVAKGAAKAGIAGATAVGKGAGAVGGFIGKVANRIRGGKGSDGGGASSAPSGGKTRLNANANANTPERPKGVPASASYNAKNQTWTASTTDKNGNSRTTVMDKNGNRQSVTDKDKNGNVTSQTQYKNGNPVSTTTAKYNDKGQKVSETTSNGGKQTTRNFDEKGRLSSQTERNADGSTTKSEWKRDANGKVTGSSVETRRRDGSKETTVFDHDENGKRIGGLRTTTSANGSERTLFVDEKGERPKGIPDSAQYDAKTQTWTSNYTDKKTGETTKIVMNRNGERQSVTKTDKNGVSTTQNYKNGNPVM